MFSVSVILILFYSNSYLLACWGPHSTWGSQTPHRCKFFHGYPPPARIRCILAEDLWFTFMLNALCRPPAFQISTTWTSSAALAALEVYVFVLASGYVACCCNMVMIMMNWWWWTWQWLGWWWWMVMDVDGWWWIDGDGDNPDNSLDDGDRWWWCDELIGMVMNLTTAWMSPLLVANSLPVSWTGGVSCTWKVAVRWQSIIS